MSTLDYTNEDNPIFNYFGSPGTYFLIHTILFVLFYVFMFKLYPGLYNILRSHCIYLGDHSNICKRFLCGGGGLTPLSNAYPTPGSSPPPPPLSNALGKIDDTNILNKGGNAIQ